MLSSLAGDVANLIGAIIVAAVIVLIFFAIGLHGVRRQANKPQQDPKERESNYWW